MKARIIQHEYDHMRGKLFVDYLSSLKENLLKINYLRYQRKCEVSYKVKSL